MFDWFKKKETERTCDNCCYIGYRDNRKLLSHTKVVIGNINEYCNFFKVYLVNKKPCECWRRNY